MSNPTTLFHAHTHAGPREPAIAHARSAAVADPGPWIVLMMPVSFALTLLALSWLSKISF